MSMNTSGLNGVMQNAAALYEKSRAGLNNFKAWVQLDSTNLNGGQQLAVKYFTVNYTDLDIVTCQSKRTASNK